MKPIPAFTWLRSWCSHAGDPGVHMRAILAFTSSRDPQRGLTPERLRRWRVKFDEAEHARRPQPALLPVRLTEVLQDGEPITVLLRTGHVLKVSHGFDEDAFARVVALLEAT